MARNRVLTAVQESMHTQRPPHRQPAVGNWHRHKSWCSLFPRSSPLAQEFTVREEVIEALEAGRTLRTQPGIDPKRVFVLGHSLGRMLIPRIGTAGPTIAGLIVLAGPATARGSIVAQTRYLAMVDGTISPDEQHAIEQATAIAISVRALTPGGHPAGDDLRRAGILLA
jgi:hypothetical protein